MINLTKPKMGSDTPLGERKLRYNVATPRIGHMFNCVISCQSKQINVALILRRHHQVVVFIIRQISSIKRDI